MERGPLKFCPASCRPMQYSISAADHRQRFPGCVWIYDPWTGEHRTWGDIDNDPQFLGSESDAIAWAAYSLAWPEAMIGVPSYCFGDCETPAIKYEPPPPLEPVLVPIDCKVVA